MSSQTKNILVVEDDPFIALDLQDFLQSEGHIVVGPAANVSEAISLIETHSVDCASLDYNLGSETVAPVAHQLSKLDVPFVFVTGNAPDLLSQANLPTAPVIGKPFKLNQITQALGL